MTMDQEESSTEEGNPEEAKFYFFQSPWKGQPNQEAQKWRSLCEPAVGYITEALWPTENMDMARNSDVHDAGECLVVALLEEHVGVDGVERTNLIQWLGCCSALETNSMNRPYQVQKSLGSVCEKLMQHWTVMAWRDGADMDPPTWADDLLDRIRKRTYPLDATAKWGDKDFLDRAMRGDGILSGMGSHQTWAALPPVNRRARPEEETNAQTDLLIFLRGFCGQTGRGLTLNWHLPG
jgi:hypothetical protein